MRAGGERGRLWSLALFVLSFGDFPGNGGLSLPFYLGCVNVPMIDSSKVLTHSSATNLCFKESSVSLITWCGRHH